MYILFHIAGIKFWKASSRKLYAVRSKGNKRARYTDSDSSEDELLDIRREVLKIISDVSKILSVKVKLNLPIGLSSILQDTFKCCICHTSSLQPPPIFARCCRRIVGCQVCVDISLLR